MDTLVASTPPLPRCGAPQASPAQASPALSRSCGLTFADACEIYARNCGLMQKTHSWRSWNRAVTERWGSRDLASFNAGDVNRYVAERRASGIAEATVRHAINHLKQLFKAVQDEHPHLEVEFPKRVARMKTPNQRSRWLTDQEEAALRRVMHADDWLIVDFYRSTGLRCGEGLAARVEDVDLKNKRLWVRPFKVDTGRWVMLGPAALRAVKQLLDIAAKAKSEWLVTIPRLAHRAARAGAMSAWKDKVFRPALRAANIEGMTFHDLRHCFASNLVRKGVPLYHVAKLLGHTGSNGMAMTIRYAHLGDKELADAVKVLR